MTKDIWMDWSTTRASTSGRADEVFQNSIQSLDCSYGGATYDLKISFDDYHKIKNQLKRNSKMNDEMSAKEELERMSRARCETCVMYDFETCHKDPNELSVVANHKCSHHEVIPFDDYIDRLTKIDPCGVGLLAHRIKEVMKGIYRAMSRSTERLPDSVSFIREIKCVNLIWNNAVCKPLMAIACRSTACRTAP